MAIVFLVCMYHYIHPIVGGHLRCFWFRDNMTSVSLNILGHVLWWTCSLVSRVYPWERSYWLSYSRRYQTFQSGFTRLLSPVIYANSGFSISSQLLGIVSVILTFLVGLVYCAVDINFHFPVDKWSWVPFLIGNPWLKNLEVLFKDLQPTGDYKLLIPYVNTVSNWGVDLGHSEQKRAGNGASHSTLPLCILSRIFHSGPYTSRRMKMNEGMFRGEWPGQQLKQQGEQSEELGLYSL